ncbi:MAG: TetR/AcrR family transcriptional regulator [Ktedonobacterales bacterium]|nr:TetR/AcrR family transcriptional regulator [Ktedonobacterales bacterium]
MGGPTRRELQKQERRNQLLDTARGLFAAQGVEGTTIKDIADAAGVAQGLLYHYFASKEDLLWAIIARDNPFTDMSEIMSNAGDRPAREVLLQASLRAYQILAERAELFRIVVREFITRPEMRQGFKMIQAIALGLLTRYLEARIAAGELRPHNPDVTARMLIGAVLAGHLTGRPAEPYLAEVVDTLMEGIAAA